MVSQSQTGQLLNLLERIGTGSSSQVSLTEKVDVTEELNCIKQKSEIDTDTSTNELDASNPELSAEDAAELFSLCQEIQDLVDGPCNTIDNSDINAISLISELPEEVTNSGKTPNKFNTSDDLSSEILKLLDTDSGVSSDEDMDFSPSSPLDDNFLDLFPTLSSV